MWFNLDRILDTQHIIFLLILILYIDGKIIGLMQNITQIYSKKNTNILKKNNIIE